jgi:hypothetical protein
MDFGFISIRGVCKEGSLKYSRRMKSNDEAEEQCY